jgi:FkbM family methyltransferase
MAKKKAAFKHPSQWIIMRAMMAHLDEDDPLVFDVGAHDGETTAHFRRMWPDSMIYSFEPVPASVAQLQKRFANDPKIMVVPNAVAQKAGTRTMYVGGRTTEMSSLLPREAEKRRYWRHTLDDQIRVEAITIDEYCSEYAIKLIHVLKIDTQGGEGRVLEGAKRMLEEGRVGIVYTEVFFVPMYWRAPLFWEICRTLAKYDITFHSMHVIGRSMVTSQMKYADALFVNALVRKHAIDSQPEEWLGKSTGALTAGIRR